ncbi:hypothetical protein GUITHDRAFT_69855, partial [Guillardia theta CCMP2712]
MEGHHQKTEPASSSSSSTSSGLARALLRALAPPPPPRASLPPWGCCNVPQTAVLVQSTSAMCVQSLDDSLSPAIHTTYRISLRSSSFARTRYPLLRV